MTTPTIADLDVTYARESLARLEHFREEIITEGASEAVLALLDRPIANARARLAERERAESD